MTPRPKIYLLSCGFPPFGRGNSITNACVANYLADFFDVEVICMEREDGYLLSYQEDQSLVEDLNPRLDVRRVRAARWWGLNEALYGIGLLPCYFLNWAWSVWRKRRELIRERGVIFAVYPVFSDLVVACLLRRQYGYPLLVDFRDDFSGVMSRGWRKILRGWYRRLEAYVLQQADCITVTTETLKRDLIKRHGLNEKKLKIVYNIVPEAPTVAPVASPDNVLRVIYAGAISRIQCPEILLQAYAGLVKRDPKVPERLRVEIYGPQNRYFRQRMQKHLVEGATFGGFLPREELGVQLARADIGFLSLSAPTYAYATPTKLFDYIEWGIPILAVLPPGASQELIERFEIGWVVEPGDVDGLARCIEELSRKPELRAHFRANMLDIRDQFRPQQQARTWRDGLMELARTEMDLPDEGNESEVPCLDVTGHKVASMW